MIFSALSLLSHNILSKLSSNDPLSNSMFDAANHRFFPAPDPKPPSCGFSSPSQPAADLTTSPHDMLRNDILASDSADETRNRVIVSDTGDKLIPDSASAECNFNTLPNARSRVRRDDNDSCII